MDVQFHLVNISFPSPKMIVFVSGMKRVCFEGFSLSNSSEPDCVSLC